MCSGPIHKAFQRFVDRPLEGLYNATNHNALVRERVVGDVKALAEVET